MFTHVVLDLDGTLIDSRIDLAAAVNHVLETLDLPTLPLDTVCTYVGEGARVLVQRALGNGHQAQFDDALARFLEYYSAHLLDHTHPYPGIAETLAALAARGVVLSVLTNKPAAMSRRILEGVGLSARFVAILGGDSLPVRKPDPAGLEHLRTLTATRRAQMLLVGDSVIDLRTARAGAVAFCGVRWGLGLDGLLAEGSERLIAEPHDLLAIVGS